VFHVISAKDPSCATAADVRASCRRHGPCVC
jgi:hypothetical protein